MMESEGVPSWSQPEKEIYEEDVDQDYTYGYNDDEDGYNYDNDDNYYDNNDDYYYYDKKGNMCSDVYDDFSFKAKAPPTPARSRSSPAPKPSFKSPKPQPVVSISSSDRKSSSDTSSDTTTLIFPPEVLHLIFSYLDNTTLCHSICYVSHQFNAIAKCYIECLWTLGRQKDEDILLKKLRLGKVNVLKIRYSKTPPIDSGRQSPFNEWNQAWKRFRDLVTQPIDSTKGSIEGVSDDQSAVDRLSDTTDAMKISDEKGQAPCLLHSVKKLIMDGGDLWTPGFLPGLLPFAQSVQILVLNPLDWSKTVSVQREWCKIYEIPLYSILQICPSIRTLVIQGAASLCLNKDAHSTPAMSTEPSFQLSRFIMRNVTVTQEILDNFLSSCPQLVSFRATNIHIRAAGTTYRSLLDTPSLSVEPLLQRAAFLCPNLVDLSITPSVSASIHTFELLLAKIAEFYPRTKHLNVLADSPMDCINPSWIPTPSVAKFLAQVTSINFVGRSHSAQQMDRLLRHTKALECLASLNSPYLRLRKIEYPKGQYLSLRTSWRCLNLRKVDLVVLEVERQKDVFRHLTYACPNVEHLTLHLSELRIGQDELTVQVTYENYLKRGFKLNWYRRSRLPLHRLMRRTGRYYGCIASRTIRTEHWTTYEGTLWALGGMSRLETLVLRCQNVKGVLCPKDFNFMRIPATSGRGKGGRGDKNENALKGRVFCHRLKALEVISTPAPRCGLSKEAPIEDKTAFMTVLRSMRPQVEYRF
ncbi:hypothetical protein BGZ96_002622 [Linnemannia gamsii]|uniref:F-box domain-containing protein n=1 Tax=Linnemannia gamsii TaxID=64522 RepID=A0ABQ7K9I2_9FUNG|nr:hypothetical protein BGZ96_002622 [Linnemannia gamsii]